MQTPRSARGAWRRGRRLPTALGPGTVAWRWGAMFSSRLCRGGIQFRGRHPRQPKLVREDVFTSIHIEKFEVEARETRLGNEEITRDIPNVGEDALKDLTEDGIVRIGAEVKAGDILVGKLTPKSERTFAGRTSLRAIFGEKAADVRDTSLTLPPGIEGVIVNTEVFQRTERGRKSKSDKDKEKESIQKIKEYYKQEIDFIEVEKNKKIAKLLGISEKKVAGLNLSDYSDDSEVKETIEFFNAKIAELVDEEVQEIDRLKRGDELPAGVLKRVVVYVATKRKVSEGDKMAGRHGNKGIVSRIVPEEDMPYLADGTPVDIVLNPLGVPSRMNVGQLLETHLGWAASPGFMPRHRFSTVPPRRKSGLCSKRLIFPKTVKPPSTTDSPANRLIRKSPSGRSTCSSSITSSMKKFTPVRSVRIPWSRSSLWAARPISAVRDSGKWKCGHSRRMAPRTPCRKC